MYVLYITLFRVKKVFILPRQCSYMFWAVLNIKSYCFLDPLKYYKTKECFIIKIKKGIVLIVNVKGRRE